MLTTDYLSKITGPDPRLALEVARFLVRRGRLKETQTRETMVIFEDARGDEWFVYMPSPFPMANQGPILLSARPFVPDTHEGARWLWEAEEALSKSERGAYVHRLYRVVYPTPGSLRSAEEFWWAFRHAPPWLCCVALLRAGGEAG